jgi:hypothetical protein
LIHAGEATLTWGAKPGGDGYQTNLKLRSAGLVSKLFKVDDTYTSFLNDELCASGSLLTANEGSRHRETKVTYDAQRKKAILHERDLARNKDADTHEIDIPACTQDVIGALYRLRTMQLEPGHFVQIPISDGKKSVDARVEGLVREQLKIPSGTYKTIKYEAFLFNNVLYRRGGHLYVWLTDDDRKLPVQIRVQLRIHIGTVTLQLEQGNQAGGSSGN